MSPSRAVAEPSTTTAQHHHRPTPLLDGSGKRIRFTLPSPEPVPPPSRAIILTWATPPSATALTPRLWRSRQYFWKCHRPWTKFTSVNNAADPDRQSGSGSGTVTVNSGGHVAPGLAGIGTLSFGGMTLGAGSILDYEFGAGSTDLISSLRTPTV